GGRRRRIRRFRESAGANPRRNATAYSERRRTCRVLALRRQREADRSRRSPSRGCMTMLRLRETKMEPVERVLFPACLSATAPGLRIVRGAFEETDQGVVTGCCALGALEHSDPKRTVPILDLTDAAGYAIKDGFDADGVTKARERHAQREETLKRAGLL